jgi:hypothetical protein
MAARELGEEIDVEWVILICGEMADNGGKIQSFFAY